mgnify:FL=1
MADRTLTEAPTLGDVAKILSELKAQGVTRHAVEYAIEKLLWEDVE